MKKYILSIAVASLALTSCDMNEEPQGTLDDKTAVENISEAEAFRNGFYISMRSITNGSFITNTDIMADYFCGTQINGNRLGVFNNGTLNTNDTDLVSLWSAAYTYIANVNYFLPKVEALLQKYGDEDAVNLTRYRGEAYFLRALCYAYLADKFCNSPTVIDPNTPATGAPLQLTYYPTGDYSYYPGRSTLKETYDQIKSDLAQAYNDIYAYETSGLSGATANLKPNANYISSYAVRALQARVALLCGEYENAIDYANQVINSGIYTLTNTDDYMDMWINDKGSEVIFVPYGNTDQGCAATGSDYINDDDTKADYVATANTLNMYDELDIRLYAFFEGRDLNIEGNYVYSPCFVKFPGNPALNTGSSNALKNLPKAFRLSELYLILAEAAYETNQPTLANNALNDLRAERIYDYEDVNLSGIVLRDAIREERAKELIGEGFRMSDLRRWKLGVSRTFSYDDSDYAQTVDALRSISMAVSFPTGNKLFILPIPSDEMQANPQLNGQQNPDWY